MMVWLQLPAPVPVAAARLAASACRVSCGQAEGNHPLRAGLRQAPPTATFFVRAAVEAAAAAYQGEFTTSCDRLSAAGSLELVYSANGLPRVASVVASGPLSLRQSGAAHAQLLLKFAGWKKMKFW